jgi:hypothetical protein
MHYLLKWWGKNARKCVSDVDQIRIFGMQGTNSSIFFTNQFMKFSYNVANKASSYEASTLLVWKGVESIN